MIRQTHLRRSNKVGLSLLSNKTDGINEDIALADFIRLWFLVHFTSDSKPLIGRVCTSNCKGDCCHLQKRVWKEAKNQINLKRSLVVFVSVGGVQIVGNQHWLNRM